MRGRPGRHAGLALLPLGRLGRTVGFAQEVGFPIVEAGRARRHIVLVVQALHGPDVHDGRSQGGIGLRPDRDPAATQQLCGRIAVRVDVNELDAGFLGPQTARRSLESCVGPVGTFGVAGPEDDHFGFLETVVEAAIAGGNADAHRVAEMMHGAPVPAFPTIRIRGDPGEADQVGEARQRAEVVAHVAPLVVGRHRESDGTGTVNALLPVDLLGDDVQRFVPADTYIAGLAAVLGIALAVGVEVDPFHRVKDALVGVDQRLERQRVGRDQAASWRAEAASTCLDHPAWRIGIVQLDRCHADDTTILDVNEQARHWCRWRSVGCRRAWACP